MGRLGPLEIIVILVVFLLLFGAGRVAELGKGLGEGIKNFKKGLRDNEDAPDASKITVKKSAGSSNADDDEEPAPPKKLAKKAAVAAAVDDEEEAAPAPKKVSKKTADDDEKSA